MTELLYLKDTYLFSWSAGIIETWRDESGDSIILDQTLFYPQWGGQPSDIGLISNESAIFRVTRVRIDEYGIVSHYGSYESWEFKTGTTISMQIDQATRLQNARNHSAGHLIDVAMKQIRYDQLKPMKWHHFPDGCYVEYSWRLDEDITEQLQEAVNTVIAENIPVIVSAHTSDKAPIGKIPRYVAFEWYEWCGCGGTHVRSSLEIGKVTIRKVKSKDTTVKVSYSVE